MKDSAILTTAKYGKYKMVMMIRTSGACLALNRSTGQHEANEAQEEQ
jgi:hypothetical protein